MNDEELNADFPEHDQQEMQTSDDTEALEQSTEELHLESTETFDVESQKAKKWGHLSKDEWEKQGRDPSKWKSPEEFNRFGNEYGEVKGLIQNLKNQNAQQAEQIKMLVEYHKQQAENTVRQARLELEEHLKRAKEMGDIDAVEKISQQKAELNNQQQQSTVQQQQAEMNHINAVFLERNKHWFNNGRPDLVQEAQQIANEIDSFYPSISYAEKVRRIEERMKYQHPEIVVPSTQQRSQIPQTRSNLNRSVTASNVSEQSALSSLSPAQRAEFEQLKKAFSKFDAKLTVKEYIQRNKNYLSQRGNDAW